MNSFAVPTNMLPPCRPIEKVSIAAEDVKAKLLRGMQSVKPVHTEVKAFLDAFHRRKVTRC